MSLLENFLTSVSSRYQPSHQISFESSSLRFPLEAEVFAGLRLVPDHRDESVLVEEVALQWKHRVVLVAVLLQRLSKLSQQIAVDFPDMDCKGEKEILKIASKPAHRFESGVETSVLS